jgi:hypothetical protein
MVKGTTLMEQGSHKDDGKPRVDLLDPDALLGLSRVLSFGCEKYAAHNWRGGIKFSRIIGSILRHLFAIMGGEDIDLESGLPHIDHLGCDWMFLSYYMKKRKDLDDRFIAPRRPFNGATSDDAKPYDTGTTERESTVSPTCHALREALDRGLQQTRELRSSFRAAYNSRSISSPGKLVDSGEGCDNPATRSQQADSPGSWFVKGGR